MNKMILVAILLIALVIMGVSSIARADRLQSASGMAPEGPGSFSGLDSPELMRYGKAIYIATSDRYSDGFDEVSLNILKG